MNNTTKARYDLARKMLKGSIDVDEVVMMSELPVEEVQRLKEELENENPEAKAFKTLDFHDFDLGPVIYNDNFSPDETGSSDDME
jgi:hypothetical protein